MRMLEVTPEFLLFFLEFTLIMAQLRSISFQLILGLLCLFLIMPVGSAIPLLQILAHFAALFLDFIPIVLYGFPSAVDFSPFLPDLSPVLLELLVVPPVIVCISNV